MSSLLTMQILIALGTGRAQEKTRRYWMTLIFSNPGNST